MDEAAAARLIEKEGADVLLDNGVSVPLWSVRLPFFNKALAIRMTMRRPCLAGQISIAREYLKMGVTSDEMWGFTKEQEMRFLKEHGRGVSRMIALTVCRGPVRRRLLVPMLSWAIRNWMSNEHLVGAMTRFVSLMGTDPFIPIIKSAERTNPMKPRTSQARKGS